LYTDKIGESPATVCFRIVCLRIYYTVRPASCEQKLDTNCEATVIKFLSVLLTIRCSGR